MQRPQGQQDDLARLSRTRSGQSRRRRSPAARDWSCPSLRLPGRVVASVPESSAFQVRRPPRVVTHRPAAHALAQQPCYHNHVDHGVIVVSQSNSSRISCMQTGLCRMRTESLAAAFTVHRETDFGRERRKAPNRPRAVFIRRRDRTPGISTAETPANCGLLVRDRETPVRSGLRGGPGRTRTSNQTVMSGRPVATRVRSTGVARKSPGPTDANGGHTR
jgi:hypothetical protein